ncbi:uncharacterized protein KIAA0408-like isoform X2 [Gouania willdenowi]|uniref:Protein SOGA3-like n=1 Tax=Gouania willdenowi TaxID=441366 RepID=A0A8C5DPE3_GOUWI|nr:uncharacterized protein KIAA0408-like isoform X2 [Gouania willdenowi]
MWSALVNGGGGAGGGYVQSQGWEFVPCHRMERADRGRGKSRSPLRRISSPPTVFSHTYEPQFSPSHAAGGGEGGAGVPSLEVLRGHMGAGPEQQTQHTRLKKKFEDLKKRHVQDKEDWLREKESLLREVADIQLEARDTTSQVSRGVQAATGPGSIASQSPREQRQEASSLRREREEQRRILVETQSAAMDLRCRLELNERDWLREKAELLERFDVERREWEGQLRDMQCKIEELYCEVKKKHGKHRLDSERQEEEDVDHRLSIRSTSTGSSLISDLSQSEPLSCSSLSEANTHLPLRQISADGGCSDRGNHLSTCVQADDVCDITFGAGLAQREQFQAQLPRQKDSFAVCKDVVDTSELDAFQQETFGCSLPQKLAPRKSVENIQLNSQESSVCAGLSYNSDKKKHTTALNAALREIARVSEELCSYQDEIRKKSGDKRVRPESLYLLETNEIGFGHDKTSEDVAAAQCDLNQIYNDFRALEKENWITLSLNNTLQSKSGAGESWVTDSADPSSYRSMQMSPGVPPEMDTAAPPLPPRSSSWNLSAPLQLETELYIPDTPVSTTRKCHNPCVLVDKKCNSPSIVKKFEAMLQENEGKVLIDGELASCSVPANSNCSTGCCHNRWSCDASKLTGSKLASYGTVQKSFSEVNIRSAGKDLHSASKSPELQMPSFVRELPVDLLLSSLETAPVISDLQGSRRNLTLERKTAEFNRTLFQAEMGRGLGEQDHVTPTDTFSVLCQSVHSASQEHLHPKEMKFQTHCTDAITNVNPEVALLLSLLDSTVQSPEVQPRETSCAIEVQEIKRKQEAPSAMFYEQPQTDFCESSQILTQQCEIKHLVQTEISPKKNQLSAAPESLFSDSVLSIIPKPGLPVDNSISTKENSHREKPQLARSTVSLQQVSAENKQRAVSQAKHVNIPVHHQPDSSRPGPRMMNDHPWKPLTLAAYPRPEGSRSNYGAVEKILKNYESAARAQKTQNQVNEMTSSPNVSLRLEESVTEMNRLNMDPLSSAPTLRHTQTSRVSEAHITHAQLSGGSGLGVKEIQLIVQENEKNSSSSVQKNFSRPACPANRRLPSRWASRSPTSSSSASSSPSSTPVVHPSFLHQKRTSSFTYIETVIM